MYNKTITRFGFCDIHWIIKVPVKVTQKPNPIIVYNDGDDDDDDDNVHDDGQNNDDADGDDDDVS